MRSRQALVVFVQREFSNPFTTAHINKEAEREFNACVNFVRWKRHYGKQCMTVCLCVGEHKHRFRIWQATHIHNLLTVTHIHSNVKSKWAMFAVVSCVMLSKQTIRMEQMKKRERERVSSSHHFKRAKQLYGWWTKHSVWMSCYCCYWSCL